MNKEMIERILTDESKICFTNGDEVTGSKEVSKLLLRCCEEYLQGYQDEVRSLIVKGLIIGSVTTIAVTVGIKKILKNRKKTQEQD